jgi:RNA polymerase-binding transcription factor DksA
MPLTAKQLDTLRAALEKRRGALSAELRQDAARTREEPFGTLAGEVRDRGDESVADLIADAGEAELSRDLAELREVEAALERLAGQRYGVCLDCGAGIDFERLRASPAASRCTPCQERHEKTFRGATGPKL